MNDAVATLKAQWAFAAFMDRLRAIGKEHYMSEVDEYVVFGLAESYFDGASVPAIGEIPEDAFTPAPSRRERIRRHRDF